jgi:hypothetical protein
MTFANRTLLTMAAVALGAATMAGPALSQTPRSEMPQPAPEQRQGLPSRPDDATGPQQGTSTAPSGSLSDEAATRPRSRTSAGLPRSGKASVSST